MEIVIGVIEEEEVPSSAIASDDVEKHFEGLGRYYSDSVNHKTHEDSIDETGRWIYGRGESTLWRTHSRWRASQIYVVYRANHRAVKDQVRAKGVIRLQENRGNLNSQ